MSKEGQESPLEILYMLGDFFGFIPPPPVEAVESLEIIGAGYGRTGTASLQEALQILGYKTYHMREVSKYKDHERIAIDAFNGNETAINWWFNDMTKNGFKATLDNPTCTLYKEQLKLFPKAKVILTLRDPEKWFDSYQTIVNLASRVIGRPFSFLIPQKAEFFLNTLFSPTSKYGLGKSGCFSMHYEEPFYLPWVKFGKQNTLNKQKCIKQFEDHYAEVRKVVPKSQLLEMKISEGWEPLCKFLNLPIPNVPFPSSNSSNEVQHRNNFIAILNYGYPVIFLLLLFLLWTFLKLIVKASKRIFLGGTKKKKTQ